MIYKIISPGLSSKNNIWLTIITPNIYINYSADDRFELPRLDHESSMLPLHQSAKII